MQSTTKISVPVESHVGLYLPDAISDTFVSCSGRALAYPAFVLEVHAELKGIPGTLHKMLGILHGVAREVMPSRFDLLTEARADAWP